MTSRPRHWLEVLFNRDGEVLGTGRQVDQNYHQVGDSRPGALVESGAWSRVGRPTNGKGSRPTRATVRLGNHGAPHIDEGTLLESGALVRWHHLVNGRAPVEGKRHPAGRITREFVRHQGSMGESRDQRRAPPSHGRFTFRAKGSLWTSGADRIRRAGRGSGVRRRPVTGLTSGAWSSRAEVEMMAWSSSETLRAQRHASAALRTRPGTLAKRSKALIQADRATLEELDHSGPPPGALLV